MSYLEFPVTNERLEAIVAGLDVKENDRILAVCGSGDQAFALLEKASYVLAVDTDERQVQYAQSRKEALANGDEGSFFPGSRPLDRDEKEDFLLVKSYFLKDKRIEEITKKLSSVKFMLGAFDEFVCNGNFNKFYISNIMGYRGFCMNSECCKIMKLFYDSLPQGGLIYIANNDDMERSRTYASAFIRLNQPDLWPKGLVLDKELTMEADSRESHMWKPAVYRKIK